MDKARYEAGLKTRREVLGDAHVDASMAQVDELTKPLQDLVCEYGWGATWARPGLPRKTRSMLNIGMLTALNRPHELKLHIRGAVNNGVTKEEMREIFLQSAVYCGFPAAIDAFRTAREVLKEIGEL